MPTLAAAATVTTRARLGTFVSSPNNHHPVQFLREVLALDDISGGRFILGIGSGGDLDSRITGDDLSVEDRVARFHDFTGLLDRLLREDHVDADGPFYTARDVEAMVLLVASASSYCSHRGCLPPSASPSPWWCSCMG